jgi:hypothetical protein
MDGDFGRGMVGVFDRGFGIDLGLAGAFGRGYGTNHGLELHMDPLLIRLIFLR